MTTTKTAKEHITFKLRKGENTSQAEMKRKLKTSKCISVPESRHEQKLFTFANIPEDT